MKRRYDDVSKPMAWEEFAPYVVPFTAVANRRLDAIIRNEDLPAEDRFDALVLRTSLGNHNKFACDRVTKSQQPATPETPLEKLVIKPLYQIAVARILGISKQRVSAIVKLRQDQGLLARGEDLANPGWLQPLMEPAAAKPRDPHLQPESTFTIPRKFSKAWDAEHPELVEKRQAAEAVIDTIDAQKLADYKASQAAQVKAAGDDGTVPDTPDSPAQSPVRSSVKVSSVPDFQSTASPTVSAPRTYGHGIDTRARAETLNRETSAQSSSPFAGSSSSLREEKNKVSVSSLSDDDEKPTPEYASPRDEVKAIYQAKTGDLPTIRFIDRIEAILTTQGKTFADYLELLKGHLGNSWKNPGGLLTYMAQTGFDAAVTAPQEKPEEKCPTCRSDDRRGAILQNGAIVPCPVCSTPEWVKELTEKEERRRAKSKGAST